MSFVLVSTFHLYPSLAFSLSFLCILSTTDTPIIIVIPTTTNRWVLRVRRCVDVLVLLLHVFCRRKHDRHRHQVCKQPNKNKQTNQPTNKKPLLWFHNVWIACLIFVRLFLTIFQSNISRSPISHHPSHPRIPRTHYLFVSVSVSWWHTASWDHTSSINWRDGSLPRRNIRPIYKRTGLWK